MSSASDSKPAGSLSPAQVVGLKDLLEVASDALVSRTLGKTRGGTLTLFAFDAGQEISEHTTPFDAFVQVIDGSLALTIGERKVIARAGEIVLMPADVPHALKAEEPSRMLLTMLRDLAG